MPHLTNRQWRTAFGTINAVCAYLLLQPQVQMHVWTTIILGGAIVGFGYIRAPDDTP